jgi:protein involved in polysaccharide export with SLBB domain
MSSRKEMESVMPLRISKYKSLVCLTVFLLLVGMQLTAQVRNGVQRDNPPSRAELEAEQHVSLSADKLIEILQQEPGLLLQVKKLLVRKAFEQGRLLDPADLTDEALFRLLRDDENIRILTTREVEDREYIRAKPTREELQRTQGMRPPMMPMQGPLPTGDAAAASIANKSQEDIYWEQQDRMESFGSGAPNSFPLPSAPPGQPQYQLPGNGTQNPARTLDRTNYQEQQNQADRLMAGAAGGGDMPRIDPNDLSQLLTVSSMGSSASGGQKQPGLPQGFNLGDPNLAASLSGMASQLPDVPDEMPDRTSSALPFRFSGKFSPPDNRPKIQHQPNPYADVPSLYDLYMQVSKRSIKLERFGMDVFRNGSGNVESLPMDLPAGPEYVLGPGDGLNINLWGGVSQRLRRVVDREGQLSLPEIGALQVAGKNLGDVQRIVQSALRTQFRDVEADISLARIRAVRVYVVGDVVSPGAYDISSLSTPLNAIYAAGGPTNNGSLRHLRHFRGKQLIQDVDAYELLLHGVHSEIAGIQSGDTILVPPAGAQVTIEGMVRRPAIYELGEEKSLTEVLELAGGVLPSGTLRHVDVERVVAHEHRTMLRLDLPESNANPQAVAQSLNNFAIQDGDQVRISPILPYADQTVYLDGHVFHPGKYPFRDGMKIADLIHSYNDLLPEPSRTHAEVIRLQPPDYTPVVLAFNLSDAMDNKDQNFVLKPFDTVRVFGRFDFEDQPLVTVTGEVRDPGDHVTNGVTHLRDAVYLAGGVTSEAKLDDAQVFRHTSDGEMEVISVNLTKALSGDPADDVLLQPKDRVFIHRSVDKLDPAAVSIQGEVARPGKYPLGNGMTAAELVRLAGGLRRSAAPQSADLTSYLQPKLEGGPSNERTIDIAKALAGVADVDVRLHDGDVLTIPQITGWNDRGASVSVKGEVTRPGTYGVQEGEKLSAVLARAGGFTTSSYPYGAVLERAQVRDLQEKTHADLIRRVQSEGVALKLIPEADADQKVAKDAALLQWQATLQKLETTPPAGRMVIHISSDVSKWANSPADLTLRAGDVLTIPKRPNFVVVDGAVYNPTAITFKPGKSAEWYLRQAGGATQMSNKKGIFVLRADGSVVGGSAGMWNGGALDAEMRPGDMVVVPEKAYSGTDKWKTILQVSQLTYAIGIGIQVAKSF